MHGNTKKRKPPPVAATRQAFRYRLLAGEIEKKILEGTYQAGEKLPSIRRLHRQTKSEHLDGLPGVRGVGELGICRSPAQIRLLCPAGFLQKTGGSGSAQKNFRAPAGQSGPGDQLRAELSKSAWRADARGQKTSLGWVIPGRRLSSRVQRLKAGITISTSTLGQYVASRFLASGAYRYACRWM